MLHVFILVKSDERAPTVPSLSLTIRSLCPPVLSQGAPSCAHAGGRAGLSESPGIWISPLAVGWDLSSFKHLLAFWGGCTCKCPGGLWIASCCTPREQNVGQSLWSIPASLSHWALLLPSPRSSRTLSFTNSFSAYFLPPFLPILPFFWMFQVFPCSLNSGS